METITSRKNEKVLRMKKLGTDRKFRYACSETMCDGEKLLWEAVKNHIPVTEVFASETLGFDVPGAKIYSVSRDNIDAVSPLKTVQSVVFSCRMRESEKRLAPNGIIIENVQDPGNVGTVIRTANAMGIDNVMLLGDCADIYNPKTIRASMGAVFRENIFPIEYEDVDALMESGIAVYAAALGENSIPIDEADLKKCVFVIGNEGKGISEKLLGMCTKSVIIPMSPECESLNAAAAAAIIMWEMRKNRE